MEPLPKESRIFLALETLKKTLNFPNEKLLLSTRFHEARSNAGAPERNHEAKNLPTFGN